MTNEKMQRFINEACDDIEKIINPSLTETQDELGDLLSQFIGYDPTVYWDKRLMDTQVEKLIESVLQFVDSVSDKHIDLEEYQIKDISDIAYDNYSDLKPDIMLKVAQKTIHDITGVKVTNDDLNIDLEYLMDSKIYSQSDFDDDSYEAGFSEDDVYEEDDEEEEDEEYDNEDWSDD